MALCVWLWWKLPLEGDKDREKIAGKSDRCTYIILTLATTRGKSMGERDPEKLKALRDAQRASNMADVRDLFF